MHRNTGRRTRSAHGSRMELGAQQEGNPAMVDASIPFCMLVIHPIKTPRLHSCGGAFFFGMLFHFGGGLFFGFCFCCVCASAAFLLLLLLLLLLFCFCFSASAAFVAFLLLLLFCFCCFSAFCVFVFLLFAFAAFLLWQLFSSIFFVFAFPSVCFLTFGSGVLLGGALRHPPTPPAPRNLHFISDTCACHEINILR